MPTLGNDPLFHGPDDPCMLYYPQVIEGKVGKGTVIVCPGGNYEFLSPLEASPSSSGLHRTGSARSCSGTGSCLTTRSTTASTTSRRRPTRCARCAPAPWPPSASPRAATSIASLARRAGERGQKQPLDAQVLAYPGFDSHDWYSPWYNGFFNKESGRSPSALRPCMRGEALLGGKGFAAPPTCLIGSTEDTYTPNEGHTDIYHAALEERDIPNIYLRDAFGEHGFQLMGGWTDGCVRWLISRGFGGTPQEKTPEVEPMAQSRA